MSARTSSGAPSSPLITFATVISLIFLVMPLLLIVIGSFGDRAYLSVPPNKITIFWYEQAASESRWLKALGNSFYIGLATVLVSLILGTMTALALSRSNAKWVRQLKPLFLAPMMIPHVIIAIGLYPTMIDFGLNNTFGAVILAHVVISTPIVIVVVGSSLASYSRTLELAAYTLGAKPIRAFRRITVPMIRNGLMVAGVFAFVTSFDELMLALFLTDSKTETLPRLIWENLIFNLTPVVAAVSTVVMFATVILLLAVGKKAANFSFSGGTKGS